MAQSPDHPELAFVQAKRFANGRGGKKPLWIVVHDMEAGEDSLRAESTAAYFATLSDGRVVSAHYCCDNDSVIQCVLLADTAWTTGSTEGNGQGINYELAGFARQTRAQWLDAFGLAMFETMAPIVRSDAAKYGIPLERRTVAELRAFKPGVTSHNDIKDAFGGSDHTDPGPAFPWDVFLSIMRGERGKKLMYMFVAPTGRVLNGVPEKGWYVTDSQTRRLLTPKARAAHQAAGTPVAPECLTIAEADDFGGQLWAPPGTGGGLPPNMTVTIGGTGTVEWTGTGEITS